MIRFPEAFQKLLADAAQYTGRSELGTLNYLSSLNISNFFRSGALTTHSSNLRSATHADIHGIAVALETRTRFWLGPERFSRISEAFGIPSLQLREDMAMRDRTFACVKAIRNDIYRVHMEDTPGAHRALAEKMAAYLRATRGFRVTAKENQASYLSKGNGWVVAFEPDRGKNGWLGGLAELLAREGEALVLTTPTIMRPYIRPKFGTLLKAQQLRMPRVRGDVAQTMEHEQLELPLSAAFAPWMDPTTAHEMVNRLYIHNKDSALSDDRTLFPKSLAATLNLLPTHYRNHPVFSEAPLPWVWLAFQRPAVTEKNQLLQGLAGEQALRARYPHTPHTEHPVIEIGNHWIQAEEYFQRMRESVPLFERTQNQVYGIAALCYANLANFYTDQIRIVSEADIALIGDLLAASRSGKLRIETPVSEAFFYGTDRDTLGNVHVFSEAGEAQAWLYREQLPAGGGLQTQIIAFFGELQTRIQYISDRISNRSAITSSVNKRMEEWANALPAEQIDYPFGIYL